MTKISKEELQWRAEDDARILAQYQEILQDKARLNRAKSAASKKVSDLNKQLQILKKVSKKGAK